MPHRDKRATHPPLFGLIHMGKVCCAEEFSTAGAVQLMGR